MPIEVAEGFRSRILEDPTWIIVAVRGDPDLVSTALRGARGDLGQLGAVKGSTRSLGGQTFGVWAIPGGAFIIVDGTAIPDSDLLEIPVVVVNHLIALGVEDAVVGEVVAEGGPHLIVGDEYAWPAVHCRLIASPPDCHTPLPTTWVESALDWLLQDLEPDHALWAQSGPSVFTIPTSAIPALVGEARRSRTDWFYLSARHAEWPEGLNYPPPTWSHNQAKVDAAARLGGHFRSAWLSFGTDVATAQMVLTYGGPEVAEHAIHSMDLNFRAVLRRCAAQVAYGYVAIEPGFRRDALPRTQWQASGRGSAAGYLLTACDEFVFDAYPFQVLGPRHLARLNNMPDGVETLADGRVGLALGETNDWITEPPRQPNWDLPFGRMRNPEVRERGWELLRPCLLALSDTLEAGTARSTANPAEHGCQI